MPQASLARNKCRSKLARDAPRGRRVLTGDARAAANTIGRQRPTALEPLFPMFVAWLCAGPGAMIQPLRRKEYKLADAYRAARDRPCANRK
jgi:hypothetical protein